MIVTHTHPWLIADLGAPHRVLSWAIYRGGLLESSHILWREVNETDLPPDRDPTEWIAEELAPVMPKAVCLLTSRDIRTYKYAQVTVEGITVEALATAGLSNAECVGTTRLAPITAQMTAPPGTINIALQIHHPLRGIAMVEAMSVATQARTAVVMSSGLALPDGPATGTGTDCIAIACPHGYPQPLYAGLHTAVGEAIGRAVRQTLEPAIAEWLSGWQAMGRKLPGAL